MIHESNNFQFINQSIHDHKNPFTQNFQNEFYFNYPSYAEQYNDNKVNKNSKINKLNQHSFYNNTKQYFPIQKSPKKKNNKYLTSNNTSDEILIIDNSVSPNTRKKYFSSPLNNSPKKNNFGQSKSFNKIYNSNSSIYSSNQQYWEKRGIKSQNRLDYIKNEKIKKENEENQIKPKIIKKSIEIANKLLNENENVFERLTNGNIQKIHEEKVKKISKKINPMKNPNINKSSKNIQRSIDDLYIWKNNIERKKKENIKKINKINKNNYRSFRINNTSEEILLERKPDYLNKKVEDRLYEEGKKIEMKKNIEKERYLEDICRPNSNKKKNFYSFVESRYMDIKKPIVENNKENKKKVKNISKNNKSTYNKNNQYNNSIDNIYIEQKDLINENEDFNQNTNIENNKNNPELIDIRRHLNDFYEMKKNNPGNIFNYFSFINGNNKINLENEINKNTENNLYEYNNNLIQNSNLNNFTNTQSSNKGFDINKYNNTRKSNQDDKRFLVQNKYMYETQMNKNDDNDYINKLINNHYNFDNVVNDENFVNEMYEKQSEHLDYLDERLKNNEQNKIKLLEKL